MGPSEWDLPDVPLVRDGIVILPPVSLPEDKAKVVQELGQWMRAENLPETSDADLVKFVHCVDYDLKRAQKCVTDFYKARNDCEDLFKGWDTNTPEVQRIYQYLNIAVLPRLTPDNCRVLMYSMNANALSYCSVSDLFKAIFMGLETIFLTEPTITGVIFIQDLGNISMYQLIKAMFSMPPKIFPYLEDGIPLKRDVAHMINCPRLIDYAMRAMRSIGRPEDYEKVRLHRGVNNFAELYEQIPREYLPSDLGGSLPSLSDLHDMTINRLANFKDVFRARQLL
ncbi:alpha-tocopherol transfer protein-like [Frankliniella occidentalis]|uniref:Alpha-tocopherol transfer protein-like n=1 Tax=Frankliniella occidentalis TaxID=133901 RepID=A0A6J1T954_FRAOC|nr:alpha-tocopherol transfer protein-like [Frankliniella occidentalis]XP_026289388.1 alpha-tocopherol transfer protein-like [Frankliniella occidentalis]